jgi:DNA polymerase-3 subunit epsilon
MPLQVAAVLETEQGRVVSALSALLSQSEWPASGDIHRTAPRTRIEQRATDVHGITEHMVDLYGQSPQMVLHHLRRMLAAAEELVGHNIEFDVGVLRRLCRALREPEIAIPKTFCTKRQSAKIVGIRRHDGSTKWPKLGEAYAHFARQPLSGAHDALVDVYACRKVYRSLQTAAVAPSAPDRPTVG